jgi:hypothetical protein
MVGMLSRDALHLRRPDKSLRIRLSGYISSIEPFSKLGNLLRVHVRDFKVVDMPADSHTCPIDSLIGNTRFIRIQLESQAF